MLLVLVAVLIVCQVKGKAAIDGLGSRLGKSGASFMQQGLVLAFGNILNAAPIVAGVVGVLLPLSVFFCLRKRKF